MQVQWPFCVYSWPKLDIKAFWVIESYTLVFVQVTSMQEVRVNFIIKPHVRHPPLKYGHIASCNHINNRYAYLIMNQASLHFFSSVALINPPYLIWLNENYKDKVVQCCLIMSSKHWTNCRKLCFSCLFRFNNSFFFIKNLKKSSIVKGERPVWRYNIPPFVHNWKQY
jgi:hypothetical protein